MAQPGSSARPAKARTVSLVLGSGGARGLAHIGVIEELEAHGYEIRAIAGSSMGALVGGIFAMGELTTYRDWVEGLSQTDVVSLLDWSFSSGGMIRGDKLIRKLKDLVGDSDIEDLPISYTAVAVDIERGREIWMSDGPLFERSAPPSPSLRYLRRTGTAGGRWWTEACSTRCRSRRPCAP